MFNPFKKKVKPILGRPLDALSAYERGVREVQAALETARQAVNLFMQIQEDGYRPELAQVVKDSVMIATKFSNQAAIMSIPLSVFTHQKGRHYLKELEALNDECEETLNYEGENEKDLQDAIIHKAERKG